MIQRMGRTGRKRNGRVVVLVTEGEEERKFTQSVHAANRVNRILSESLHNFDFYLGPKMMSLEAQDNVICKEMSIEEYHYSQVGGRTNPQIVKGNKRKNVSELTISQVHTMYI